MMKWLNRLILFMIVMPILGIADAKAQLSSQDSTALTLLEQGIHKVHIEKYEEAIKTFQQLINSYPQKPMGYALTAIAYHAIMRNYRINAYEGEFESFLNAAIKNGKKAIRKNRQDALSYYSLGGAYGYRGLHNVRKRRWLSAFFDGMRGVSNLKKALVKDPQFYDVYYGLGTYHYWRGAKSRIFSFIPIIKRDRERGIKELWIAIKKGRHTEIEGKFALVAIYFEEKDYEKARSVNQYLYERLPTNPSCLYMRTRIFEQYGQWKEAKDTIQRLLKHLSAFKHRSIGYQVECHYRIAYYHSKLGEFDQALKECKRALEVADQYDASKEMEGPIEDFKDILSQAEQLYEELSAIKSGESR